MPAISRDDIARARRWAADYRQKRTVKAALDLDAVALVAQRRGAVYIGANEVSLHEILQLAGPARSKAAGRLVAWGVIHSEGNSVSQITGDQVTAVRRNAAN